MQVVSMLNNVYTFKVYDLLGVFRFAPCTLIQPLDLMWWLSLKSPSGKQLAMEITFLGRMINN